MAESEPGTIVRRHLGTALRRRSPDVRAADDGGLDVVAPFGIPRQLHLGARRGGSGSQRDDFDRLAGHRVTVPCEMRLLEPSLDAGEGRIIDGPVDRYL